MSELEVSPFGEEEIAFPGGVPGEHVVRAYPILPDRTLGEPITNKNFYKSAVWGRATSLLEDILPKHEPASLGEPMSWLDRPDVPTQTPSLDTIEVDPPREGRPAQVWVGVPRDDTVGTTPAVRDGYILVHGRGQNGSLRIANQPLVPGTLRQALEDEGLADHQPLVLLTPGAQESAEALADDRDADVLAPDSPIWVANPAGQCSSARRTSQVTGASSRGRPDICKSSRRTGPSQSTISNRR
jgi:hypothetical protein